MGRSVSIQSNFDGQGSARAAENGEMQRMRSIQCAFYTQVHFSWKCMGENL